VKSSIVYTISIASGLTFFPFSPFVSAEETAADETPAEEKIEQQAEMLEDITVQATRVDKSLYEIPASVGYVDKEDIQYGRQQLGLDESLIKVPGLFMPNRYNFNQDLSISIRGFGNRATFGIRGVKIFVDGIPNTLPDGQGSIDSIDIGSTEHMEVIRGPSSSLYGASAGGVINLYTEDGPVDAPFAETRVSTGSYGFNLLQAKAGGQKEALNYFVSAQRFSLEGYRDHSEIERYILNSKFSYDIDATSDFTLTASALHKPEAQDPGGLCKAAIPFSPAPSALPPCTGIHPDRQAAQRNNTSARFDAGESVDQQQFGLLYHKLIGGKHEITVRNYYLFRDFDANLPFGPPVGDPGDGGIIDLNRFFVGGGLQDSYSDQFAGHDNRLTVGFDIDSQMDDRKSYDNNFAVQGPLAFDQNEDVFSWGVYLQNEFDITDNLQLTFGSRYDEVEFEFTDNFLSDGDQSGTVKFSEWSPQVGLLWHGNDAINLYGTYSTSFETPSTREFAAPLGPGGFNTSLVAQTAKNYEIGIKGFLPGKVSYQLSLFHIDTKNELLPAGENAGGSTYFTNAGETSRNGLEAGLTYNLLPGLDVTLNYTYSDFEFEKLIVPGFGSFAGEKIPGVPEQFGYAELAYYHPSGFYGAFDMQYVDRIFVNNAYLDGADVPNLITQGLAADDYYIANLRMGYTTYIGDTEFTPFFGINNITNQRYIGNIRINEGNTRYFEPAPERNFYAGISLTFH
jgi:iron complex outermembrane receptor protein